MKHVITLSATGKQMTIGQYVTAWKACKAAPAGTEYDHGLCGWWPATREQILREFEEGMHDRINKHIESYGVGRKWDSDWQRDAQNTARDVNTPRLIVHWIPSEFRSRLAHRVYREGAA